MFTLYQILDRATYHIYENGDFGAISVTERSCAAPISKVERPISDRFCATLRYSMNRYLDRIAEVNR